MIATQHRNVFRLPSNLNEDQTYIFVVGDEGSHKGSYQEMWFVSITKWHLWSLRVPTPTRVWDNIFMDFVKGLPLSNGKVTILW